MLARANAARSRKYCLMAGANQRLKLTGAAILVLRGIQSLQAALAT